MDRTDRLARCVLAMHAGHGHEVRRFGMRRVIAFEIRVNANPVHLAAAHHLLLADDGNIVFRLAGDGAAITADAIVQIYRHAPGVTHALVFVVKLLRIVERFIFTRDVGLMIVRTVV